MIVSQLITAAFAQASRKYPDLHQLWTTVSFRIGGVLPNSLLLVGVQRDGWLDLVLRCMEDDAAAAVPNQAVAPNMTFLFQKMLSEMWVGGVYETLRLLIERKLAPDTDEFRTLAHHLRLLRIPLEKHELAMQGQLQQPIQMQKSPPNNDQTDIYQYDKSDPRRSHIMPSGLSPRGSLMWQVIDVKANQEQWLERRDLADRLLSLWGGAQPAAA